MTGMAQAAVAAVPRRRLRRLFAFGKGIVAPLGRGPVSAVPLHPATTGGVVVSPELVLRSAGALRRRMKAADVRFGVRADRGFEPLSRAGGLVTSGLDGLAERLARMREDGAAFAVWTMAPADSIDGGAALAANASAAARFARTCHDLDLLPLIRAKSARTAQLRAAGLFSLCTYLDEFNVDFGGLVVVTRPCVDRTWDVLPSRLGGIALVTAAVPPASAADWVTSVCDRQALPWPVTFYLGR